MRAVLLAVSDSITGNGFFFDPLPWIIVAAVVMLLSPFASAVAGFGMLLRKSEHRGSLTVDRVRSLAQDGLGEDPHGYRRGLLELIDAYAALSATQE